MSMLCCFKSCRPRYKRLVNNIFPRNPDDGIVRGEMEKLTYYALSAPEKLHRIGAHLSQILGRHIARRRDGYVYISMEALNQLLLACHAQQINLFVESFLKMVATLLESNNIRFQILATESFIKFSKIEEDTASYHRRYDFFVSKFSAMCHNNHSNTKTRLLIRVNGVGGLQGVIRKTVSDELQVNIWDKQHMDKIVPSLLINMQCDEVEIVGEDQPHPSELAEQALRELLSRASFATLMPVLNPALAYLDQNQLWTPSNRFAVKAFTVIMYSVQSQYSHLVVKSLLDHLGQGKVSETIQCSMLDVMCDIVAIPSSAALGPSVIDVFNMLALQVKNVNDHKSSLKKSLIKTTGALGKVIPDYQKLEAVTLYLNKAKSYKEENRSPSDIYITSLLQCMLKIAESYKVVNLSSISTTLTDPLFRLTLMLKRNDRRYCLDALLVMFDREENKDRIKCVDSLADVEALGLEPSNASKFDREFVSSQFSRIANFFIELFLLDDNHADDLALVCKCAVVLSMSLLSSDNLVDMIRLVVTIQSVALERCQADEKKQVVVNVLSATAACMLFIAHFSRVPKLHYYVEKVLASRPKYLLPSSITHNQQQQAANDNVDLKALLRENKDEMLFSIEEIAAACQGWKGYVRERLVKPLKQHRLSQIDDGGNSLLSGGGGVTETDSDISVNISNVLASPTAPQQQLRTDFPPSTNITFAYLKQALYNTKPNNAGTGDDEDKKRRLAEHYKTATFEQLLAEMPPDPSYVNAQYLKKLFVSLAESEEPEEREGIDSYAAPTMLQFL